MNALTNPMVSEAGRLIQLALAPIFLLTAASALLGVFSTRLSGVSERIRALKATGGWNGVEFDRLKRRLRLLELSVVFAVICGALTCAAAMLLFIEGVEQSTKKEIIFPFFAGALFSAIVSLIIYGTEVIMSGRHLHAEDIEERSQP